MALVSHRSEALLKLDTYNSNVLAVILLSDDPTLHALHAYEAT